MGWDGLGGGNEPGRQHFEGSPTHGRRSRRPPASRVLAGASQRGRDERTAGMSNVPKLPLSRSRVTAARFGQRLGLAARYRMGATTRAVSYEVVVVMGAGIRDITPN
jgi:hypothetical protein